MADSPLLVRSKASALEIIRVCNEIKRDQKESVLTNQLVRSGTSIGANIREAFYAHSKADFISHSGNSRNIPRLPQGKHFISSASEIFHSNTRGGSNPFAINANPSFSYPIGSKKDQALCLVFFAYGSGFEGSRSERHAGACQSRDPAFAASLKDQPARR